MDYVVKRETSFRKQMVDLDLIEWFECIANFKRYKKVQKVDIVTDKMMRIVQTWGILFPVELIDYINMYNRTQKKGVVFVKPTTTDFELYIQPPDGIQNCIDQISETIKMIDDTLEHIYDNECRVKSAQVIFQHSKMVKTQHE
ncbi:hypothetical protein EIN_017720 [Entamoeba invadens IP1]|uniref:hypothetical protein n=1 Tax=Entamoeba invadens IP1 TaxID=370355 RepID=UPI0002C3ECC0|nr:hypothetical protein EIN_017720 [Entamoeba invadens IP1]ELP90463.1 hypothetical protein EIN_017720 [Entamoeba invadens IP1]|eukprot:XP_004257234.1 hypothetical protein EIN_017720 [Entamoeba invadens IP1]